RYATQIAAAAQLRARYGPNTRETLHRASYAAAPMSDDAGDGLESNVAAVTLEPDEIAELMPFGQVREVMPGDILYRAGDATYDFLVILEGEVSVVRPDTEGEAFVIAHGAGRFLGELNLLTGQRVYLTARVTKAGRVLAIAPDDFRRVMNSTVKLSNTI